MGYIKTKAEAAEFLANRQNFNSGSLTALTSETHYCVFSYSQVIARTNLATGETWLNPAKYSQTTSRHTNLVRKAWGLN